MSEPRISIDAEKIKMFCQKHPIMTLALFGSVLTPHFNSSSDVDFLVNFDSKYISNLFDLVDMESELSQIVGRTVDLKTPRELSPYFREDVLSKAKMIYG